MKDLILLHGALGSIEQLSPMVSFLQSHFTTHTFNFSGHGGLPVEGEFSINRFAEELDNYINRKNLQGCYVFGYSMGGYVALQLASRKPEAISKIMTLGTKFDWTPESAAKEIKMMNPEKIESKVPEFARMLRERHAPADWKAVLEKTVGMLRDLVNGSSLKETDFGKIKCEVLISLGSEDQMVSDGESRFFAGQISQGRFMILEKTPHPIEAVDPEIICGEINNYFF